MSDTLKTLLESLFMIGAISAGFVWYAVVAARREDRDASTSTTVRMVPEIHDPDAHLGRCGAE